ncbi:hypothetical protein [Arcobacter sp. CECT 8989]|uniref:hypothetical protein n=1 Tax=Arcobacter sp. CECT 8989 TaxID=2044509 RepID=UPI0013E959A3|nr:hypothetical protein [Arcobacter sp. CECT 8989]
MIHNIFHLSRKSNGFGIEIEYLVVKDYCEKFELDSLEIFQLLKSISSRVSQ